MYTVTFALSADRIMKMRARTFVKASRAHKFAIQMCETGQTRWLDQNTLNCNDFKLSGRHTECSLGTVNTHSLYLTPRHYDHYPRFSTPLFTNRQYWHTVFRHTLRKR